MREVLRQKESSPVSVAEQIGVLHAVTQGLFDHLDLDEIESAEKAICQNLRRSLPDICKAIEAGDALHDEYREALAAEVERALRLNGLGSRDSANANA